MGTWFKKFTCDLKMRSKLLIAFTFVGVIPLILVSIILMYKYSDRILAQIYSLNEASVKQLQENIENHYESYLLRIDNVSMDTALIDYVNRTYPEGASYEEKYYDFTRVMDECTDKYSVMEIGGIKIRLYTSNPYILADNYNIMKSKLDDMKSDWYRGAVIAKGSSIVSVVKEDSSEKSYFVISKMLKTLDNETKPWTNILTMWIQEDELYNFIKNENPQNRIYVLSSNNSITTSNDRETVGKKAYEVLGQEYLGNANGVFAVGDEIVFVNKFDLRRSHNFGKMIIICPTAHLTEQMQSANGEAIGISIFIMIIAGMFLILLSNQITNRLKMLVDAINAFDMKNIRTTVGIWGKDEIGHLARSFEKMLSRLKALIDESFVMTIKMQEAEIHQNKMELNALQSQINPHFLYNVMESVRMSLLENNDTKNAAIIQKYAALVRSSAEWGNDSVTVEQELKMVENYFLIQKYRFEERFSYNINVHESAKSAVIPKFTLMPLVENAFEHGISDMFEGGHIEVFSCVTETGIELVVADNGSGMTYERLCEIKDQLEQSEYKKEARIGVYNVHRRIQLMYGEGYGLTVDSTEGAGSLMIVLIPNNRNNEYGKEEV